MSKAKAKPKRKPPNAGKGRVKGVPNKITMDVRKAIAQVAEANAPKLSSWLTRVAKKDPGRAADIFLRAIEYHIPKLSRTELDNAPGSDGLKIVLRQYQFDAAAVTPE